jgi:hypothetical protein
MTPHHTAPAFTAYDLAPETAWRKASYSSPDQNCIEVAELASAIAVRDSKHPGPTFKVSTAAFSAFIDYAKNAAI